MGTDGDETPRRRRGRPSKASGEVALSRDALAATALRIAGAEGFGAVTMHRVAAEHGVSARALYNHVRDRQELIDLTAALLMEQIPDPVLVPGDWRTSIRQTYRHARAAYRRFPRATLISLDEQITTATVPVRRIEITEAMLQLLVDAGLTPAQAELVRGSFLIDVFGFVLLIDYRYDRAPASARAAQTHPVPPAWLAAHPDAAAPIARGLATAPAPTSDEMFEAMVELRIGAIEHLLAAGQSLVTGE